MRSRHPIRRSVIAATVLMLTAGVASAEATPTYREYVALGDSFAAIASVFTVQGTPGCFRSTDNYAGNVAKALGARLDDRSCSSATTAHMTTPQSTQLFGTNPPQFDGLTTTTDLVTVTIGGNDFGFESSIGTCGVLAVTDPFGNPCERHNNSTGTDKLVAKVDEIAPKIAAVLDGIHARAPRAKIVVVGYLPLLPPTTGCFPLTPMAVGDVAYLHGIQLKLNAMLAGQAARHHATAVDLTGVRGHDVCQLPWNRWVEPVLPAAPTTPFHPNSAGQRGAADLILATLGH
ncbi:GDSL-like Lipase/Acylhydrolase family protein [Actinokineospora alba]|uniref:GDSL-like Lipase/Acylhydrolase family protein n=1 Tax=Actinokineospora alba TaxID=504798 RepID=A0A1H0EPD5_9PSEU|nr:SGNH/GDSL hydrolase family protein [Actinokineospora alba]TDP69163.1 GDSL-like lipase/acylhydrolase family protein [Actinokineospora alba]SDI22977.1 GDSL-like Lipase/Acylhydrolase family protein [Actinokineospora alba]SDN84163.1 GDSL-like Lipase/Acylhydrolase family protein [Actinokineospora alba]